MSKRVAVSNRMAQAMKHWRKCPQCRETREGALDEAIGCLAPEFAPIDERMRLLQEEYAELEAEKMRLVEQPIPRGLWGRCD